MNVRRSLLIAVIALASVTGAASPLAAPSTWRSDESPRLLAPVFVFSDPFWLNLHHFLYVLGRVEAKMPDIQRRAVAGAAADQSAGFASLGDADQRTWRAAVSGYAHGLSQKDAVFDAQMVDATRALANAGSAASLGGVTIDAAVAATLERAAPVYRKIWWPAHHRANEASVAELQRLLDQYQARMLDFITRAYQERWPADGYPVNISGYANWAGAYSTRGRLLVISSLDSGNRGALGLETVFHEAMHQWDDAMADRLQAAATRQRVATVPDLLTHAMIFFTAGEAVRSVIPSHVPYAELNGLWRNAGLGALKPVLDAAWKPYLEGTGTLDQALDAIVKRMAPTEASVAEDRH